MENNFSSIVEKSNSILILLPTKPYFDQVAAGLSLYLSLKEKKSVQIFSPTPMTVEFNRLVGVDKIGYELGNRNMIIRFSNYNASDIERVSYDIEDGKFKLTVIPKTDINPPTKDQVEINYAGVSVDTVIIIGGADESHFPSIQSQELVEANIIHIGIREISLSADKKYLSFSRPASSICEIMYALLADSKMFINPDIATNLIMGIEETSKNFSGEGITAETFYTIADLIQYGGIRGANQPSVQGDFPQGSIPGQSMIMQKQHVAGVQQQSKVSEQQDPESQLPQDDQQIKNPPKDWFEPKILRGDTPIS